MSSCSFESLQITGLVGAITGLITIQFQSTDVIKNPGFRVTDLLKNGKRRTNLVQLLAMKKEISEYNPISLVLLATAEASKTFPEKLLLVSGIGIICSQLLFWRGLSTRSIDWAYLGTFFSYSNLGILCVLNLATFVPTKNFFQFVTQ